MLHGCLQHHRLGSHSETVSRYLNKEALYVGYLKSQLYRFRFRFFRAITSWFNSRRIYVILSCGLIPASTRTLNEARCTGLALPAYLSGATPRSWGVFRCKPPARNSVFVVPRLFTGWIRRNAMENHLPIRVRIWLLGRSFEALAILRRASILQMYSNHVSKKHVKT